MIIVALATMLLPIYSQAQQNDASSAFIELEADTDSRVEVQPISSDGEINRRLTNIMASTGWFDNIQVEVNDGVVFLDGWTSSDKYRSWAGDLANRTRDVVAVAIPPLKGFSPSAAAPAGPFRAARENIRQGRLENGIALSMGRLCDTRFRPHTR